MLWLGGDGADERLLALLRAEAGSTPAALARAVTALGGGAALVTFAAGAALWLAWRRRFADALVVLAAPLSCRVLVALQKELVERPRPPLDLRLVDVSSASFPSGHAANAAATFACLVLFLPGARRPLVIVAAALLVVAIGLSRPLLGVHWPSDVVGGWAFGLAWAFAWAALARRRISPS